MDIGWDRVLIEGATNLAKNLVDNSPDAHSFNLAVCDTVKYVHFSEASGVGGILEFMSDLSRQSFHKQTLYMPQEQWHKIPRVKKLLCVPLRYIFDYSKISHINFWILDLEGGELSVLKSVDWNTTTFDVICVETDTKLRPEGYQENITHLLRQHGYSLAWEHKRNTWYLNKNFVPSSRPDHLRYTKTNGFKNYPNSTVVKLNGYLNKELYIILNGSKFLIPSWDLYLSLHLDRKQCVSLSQNEFDDIPTGSPFPVEI